LFYFLFLVFLRFIFAYIVLSVRLKLCKTAFTDELILEGYYVLVIAAEVTTLIEFAKADRAVLRVNFDSRSLGHIHFLSELLRNNDSSKLVDVTNYSYCFHFFLLVCARVGKKRVISADLVCVDFICFGGTARFFGE